MDRKKYNSYTKAVVIELFPEQKSEKTIQIMQKSIQKKIMAVRDELGLTQYKFPWED